MKRKRILSWILSMALVLSVFNIPLAGVYALGEDEAAVIPSGGELTIDCQDTADVIVEISEYGGYNCVGDTSVTPSVEYAYTSPNESILVDYELMEGEASIEWTVNDPADNAYIYYDERYDARPTIWFDEENENSPASRVVTVTAEYWPNAEAEPVTETKEITVNVTVEKNILATVESNKAYYNIYKEGTYYDYASSEYKDGPVARLVGVAPSWAGVIAETVNYNGKSYPVVDIRDLEIRNYGISGKPFDDEKLDEAKDPNRLYGNKRGYDKDANGKWYYTDYDQVISAKSVNIPKNCVYVDPSEFSGIKGLTAVNVASGHKDYYSKDGVVYRQYDKDDWYNKKYDDNNKVIGYDETKLDPDLSGVVPVKDAAGKYVLDAKNRPTFKKINASLVYYPLGKTAKKFVIPEGVEAIGEHYGYYDFGEYEDGTFWESEFEESWSLAAFYGSYDKVSLETIVLPASFDIAQYSFYERDTKTTYVDEIFDYIYFQTWEKNKFQSWNIRVFTKGDANAVNALKIHAAGYEDTKTGVKKLPIAQSITKGVVKAGKLKVNVTTKDNGDIAINSIAKNNKKTVTVPAKITINGIKYNVTDINAKAFKNCKKATKIVIPASVTLIKKNAFNGAKKLKTVQFKTKKSNITFKKGAFKGVKKSVVAKVPKKMKKAQMTKFQKAIKKGGFKGTVKK